MIVNGVIISNEKKNVIGQGLKIVKRANGLSNVKKANGLSNVKKYGRALKTLE